MPYAIGLYQFELSHREQAPHIGMCLFVNDLIRDGHRVRAALVAHEAVEALLDEIRSQQWDLIAVDSIFPVDVIGRIKTAFPATPVVVGGVNALGVFLSSPADMAVVGPGRRAMRELARRLADGATLEGVPNLFRRTAAGEIDHSGIDEPWRLEAELLPYTPFLDWGYVGGERDAAANHHQLSIVPEFGCVYQEDAFTRPLFADLGAADGTAELDGLRLTSRALAAVEPFYDNARGCSFCVFRFQPLTLAPVESTLDLVMLQLATLQETTGATQFSLQTENPFRILEPLLERAEGGGLRLDALLIRTLPLVLLHKVDAFRRGLDRARAAGTTLVLQQLGFESFADAQLERFNKGISAADNRRAARLLAELGSEYGDTLDCFSGHGLMLFDPWTTLDELAQNIEAIDRDAPFLARAVGLGSRLIFYDPFNPIFRRARAEGLVVPSHSQFGWDFRFADPVIEDFVQMVAALNRHLAKRLADGGIEDVANSRGAVAHEGWVFRQALDGYRRTAGDPAALRQAFFDVARRLEEQLGQRPTGANDSA